MSSDHRPFRWNASDAVAHICATENGVARHALEEHLAEVAGTASRFADEFGGADWARLAGQWHDLGKYRAGFQSYIHQCGDPDAHIEGRVAGSEKTHSAAGALWARQRLAGNPAERFAAHVLSYLIAGHHAGLADWFGGLNERLASADAAREIADTLAVDIPATILDPSTPAPSLASVKAERADQPTEIPGRFALWVRMLFSCLVDADFLDTEAFMSPEKSVARNGFLSVAQMQARLDERLARLAETVAARGEADSAVNRRRAEVLRACRDKAALPSGVFSLTVPTGGGKTLSSLAFALRHAVTHGKRRFVYAIPYTSIIEQTASVFADIFGDDNVIEHHSNIEADGAKETARSRLACENWDAPLIVTTNVQLLESLFAARTSRCRKLHNLVGSVIVLDEAQLLPVPFLQPVVDVLRLLVRDYGVTLLLCTATQPDLNRRTSFDQARGLQGFPPGEITEIVNDVPGLYAALERVRVHRPPELNTPSSWDEVARDLAQHDAALAIVGRRADARELFGRLKREHREGLWHLSGLMCAQHRSDTIASIKGALTERRRVIADGGRSAPLRVISTQLVEAGVDIDFPVVYRALAGLDSLAQAAGRCNREGRLQRGEFHVFVPPKAAPPGLLRMAENSTRVLWSALGEGDGPMAVERFGEFFRHLYGNADLDAKRIRDLLRAGKAGDVSFRTAAERFRLIDEDDGAMVIVRYRRDEADDQIDQWLGLLRKNGPDRWLLRKLQRYGVTVYRRDLDRLVAGGDIAAVGDDCPGLYVQASDVLYDRETGLNVDGAPGDPASLVL